MKKHKFNLKKTIVVKSLMDSFIAIKENKLFFLFLILGEIAFVILVAMGLVYFSGEILTHAKPIFEPLSNIAQDGQIDLMSLYDNPAEVLNEYSLMKMNVFLFLMFLLIVYLIFEGVNWDLANMIAVKQDFLIYPVKFWLLTLIFLIPVGVIMWIFTRISVSSMIVTPYIYGSAVLAVVLVYFMRISYTFAVRYKIKDIFTGTFKDTFVFGAKKAHIYIITFLIICGLNVLSMYLIYLLLEANILFLLLALILFILILGWEKIYLMVTTCNVVECKIKK
jgi:hypothetical protein